jgi:hypothetical protein
MVKTIERLSILVGILFLLSGFDTLFFGLVEGNELHRMLPGQTHHVMGALPELIPSLDSLAFTADSPFLQMQFTKANGTMWRGNLRTDPAVEEGLYRYWVHLRWDPASMGYPEYSVRVFESPEAYHSSFHSFFHRLFEIPPWFITVGTLPLLFISFIFSYRLSTWRESLLNEEGFASVFRVSSDQDQCRIIFGLGRDEGIRAGDSIRLLNKEWQPVGDATIKRVWQKYAMAEVDPSLGVTPDYLVCVKRTSYRDADRREKGS